MTVLYILFYTSLVILFYAYLGYGLLLLLLPGKRNSGKEKEQAFPALTMIIAAWNEAPVLEQKIQNTKALVYPPGLLKIIIVTDGSTDDTVSILKKYPEILHLHQPVRQGKYAAIREAMQQVRTPIVVFTDANSQLNPGALRSLTAHYADPRTGAVAGEKKILTGINNTAVGQAEGMYWRYESFMKKLDARFYSVVGAAGELFSIRTELFSPMEHDMILDDFIISMQVGLQGYRTAYEPGAFAAETASASLQEEQKRKIRIAAGAYEAAGILRGALTMKRYPRLFFQYFSRRILRWFYCPFLLIVILITNCLIVLQPGAPFFYQLVLAAQGLYYLLSLAGWLLLRTGKKAGVLGIPYYFLFMNFCLVRGLLLYLRKKQVVLWEKAERQPA